MLAVSGAGVPLGETLDPGVYGLELGIVVDGVVVLGVPVLPIVVPVVAVPLVVVPVVDVPEVEVPDVAAPLVCAQAAPPATTVNASANAAFLRSYLITQLPLISDT